ncbi:putative UDP-glucosyl transferase 73B6 [Wolffia australiana]
MGSDGQQLHVFVFPLMAAGHLLPATDIAILLAAEGVKTSILATAGNISAVEISIKRSPVTRGSVDVLLVEPSPTLNPLPDNISAVTSAEMQMEFFISASLLRPSFEKLVDRHRPNAIISDSFYPWTTEIAEEYEIPRLDFHGTSFFSNCVGEELNRSSAALKTDPFIVSGLPHKIELSRSQLPNPEEMRPDFRELFARMKEAGERSYGLVVNSFYELEPDYVNHYRKKNRAWHIGPTFLRLSSPENDSQRGGDSGKEGGFLKWLDEKPESSVLYVCFGSLCRFTEAQLGEIATGLENSGCYFIWVVRKIGEKEQWLPEGFEERVAKKGMGLVVRGWAPQLVILNHPAVGGFVTHCGWNSSLESITAGVPVVTWPMFADQFFNERLLVDVLKVGLDIGVKKYSICEEEREVVKAEEIAVVVERLMGKDAEAEERRERARELSVAARRAVEEGGGSSRTDLRSMIQELSQLNKN